MRVRFSAVLALLLGGSRICAGAAEHVSIAAAANLVFVLEPLDAGFTRANPGVAVTDTIGASGSLVSQIENGAPYDVFLSADLQYPKKLIGAGGAKASSLVVFAMGRLVLWTARPGLDISTVVTAVHSPLLKRLAIANPATAPYGRAAEEVLARLGIAGEVRTRLVFGENISQTAEFVMSGNADAGFVALSLVLSPKLRDKGRWLEVPPELYAPIAQGAVLTLQGAGNPAARRYLAYLASPPARAVFVRFGYGSP